MLGHFRWFKSVYVEIGIVATVLLIIMVSTWNNLYRPYVSPLHRTLAPPHKLYDAFEKSVFHDAGKRMDRVRKWDGEIRIYVFGRPYMHNLAELSFGMDILSRLTGQEIKFTERKKSNFGIYFASYESIKRIVIKQGFEQSNPQVADGQNDHSTLCLVRVTLQAKNLGPAYALISTNLLRDNRSTVASERLFGDGPKIVRTSCLMQELMNGLGFLDDFESVSPSVLNGYPNQQNTFSANDKLLIRTLYDPRLEAGMPREEALVIAKQVIEELVAAYNEHGEEALYQR